MAACSFGLRFLYVLAGWEGSAADSVVLQAALQTGFTVPAGMYFLYIVLSNLDTLLSYFPQENTTWWMQGMLTA
jgi:hypothetical protein